MYTLRPTDKAGYLDTTKTDLNLKNWPASEPIGEKWTRLEAKLKDAEKGYVTDLTQVLANPACMVFSERAMEETQREGFVTEEWLPVVASDRAMWLLHLLRVVDALDDKKTTVRKFKKSGRTGAIKQHAFKPNMVPSTTLFTAKNDVRHQVFCTDNFKQFVQERQWKGFSFFPVWDDKHEPFSRFPSRDEIRSRPEIFGPDGFVGGYEGAWPEEWKSK